MRAVAALLLTGAAVVAGAAPAAAVPVLEPGDAAELANALAEATEEQDICYGWAVSINDANVGFSRDVGSSLGPGALPVAGSCERTVIFSADVTYTSDLSEAADYATFSVVSNFSGGPTGDDLDGFDVSGLLGDNDDLVLFNVVASLPAIVAELGLAPPVLLEANTEKLPASDRPTNTPGSDKLRTFGPLYGLVGVLLLGGVGWAIYALTLPASGGSGGSGGRNIPVAGFRGTPMQPARLVRLDRPAASGGAWPHDPSAPSSPDSPPPSTPPSPPSPPTD